MISVKWLLCLSLLASSLCSDFGLVRAEDSPESTALTDGEEESTWGRIYLRNGVTPIQYFRSTFGSVMINDEVELVFPQLPEHQLGCEPLTDQEQAYLGKQNGSVALVVQRGECPFTQKAQIAAKMGASVLIVVSNTEDTERPRGVVATNDDDDIRPITTVMVRRSAGDLMLAVSRREKQLFARLVPMKCERQPYVCTPRSDEEKYYIDSKQIHSGLIITTKAKRKSEEQDPNPQDNNNDEEKEEHEESPTSLAGEFLSATFGGPFVMGPIDVATFPTPSDGCNPLDQAVYTNKLVMFESSSRCSDVQRVRVAQDAGASVALIVVNASNPESRKLLPPMVQEAWMGYDVHIASATISSRTAQRLVGAARVYFQGDNEIAREWDELHQMLRPNKWPVKKKRQDQKIRKLLKTHAHNPERLEFLQQAFVQVAKGDPDRWHELVQKHFEQQQQQQHHHQQQQHHQPMDAAGTGSATPSQESTTLGAPHQEL